MAQALYRSYRSRSFDEVVGQDHITSTLKKAIKSGRISHAYLFTGPRGVGKTSVARILAREVNGLPYDGEEVHLDIIEIDAASNGRIDEVRDLRDKVHTAPTSAKYKVYIIDEVHMLSIGAFNALLKTLEEPPEHVIFILATTEAHKLPETIISRTQRFNFKPIDRAHAEAHLAEIAKNEKIKADPEALKLIAELGDGSFRDSISLLDQLSSAGEKLTAEVVREHLGLPKAELVGGLLGSIAAGSVSDVLQTLDEAQELAVEPVALAKAIAKELRASILSGQSNQTDLLRALGEVPAASEPSESLEIALIEAALANQTSPPKVSAPKPVDSPEQKPKIEPKPENKPPKPTKPTSDKPKTKPTSDSSFDLSMWNTLLEQIRPTAAALYTALRLASPELEDQKLTLYFEFDFHKKKVDAAQSKSIIGQAIEDLCGANIEIECLVDKTKASSQEEVSTDFYNQPPPAEDLQAISNIFGGGEVLES